MIALASRAMPAARRAPAWASFHLHLPGRFEPFLAGPLLERVEAERAAGRVRRFFFVRYGEGGLHLRLRFLPAGGVSPDALGERVAAWARAHLEAEGAPFREVRVEAHPYDRADLYFGETWDSVHAELLNEATSWLAMRLLRAPGMELRSRRWLACAAALRLLLARAAEDGDDLAGWMEESRAFARLAGREVGSEAPERGEGAADALLAPLRAALPRMAAALAGDPAARRIPRLLRRARRAAGGRRFVGVHALHLLCNKLGFSLADEDEMFGALLRLEGWADGGAGGAR